MLDSRSKSGFKASMTTPRKKDVNRLFRHPGHEDRLHRLQSLSPDVPLSGAGPLVCGGGVAEGCGIHPSPAQPGGGAVGWLGRWQNETGESGGHGSGVGVGVRTGGEAGAQASGGFGPVQGFGGAG
ncbi:hypothetical protein GCM10023214_03090 [Amycolatopsis dongchuanensis]|uniref:Uncharacterized protein n=1 Tax=Amycolatopsis dongchuanensis TaxID=1070866 RepID=A0ABP9PTZ0_9PSEU